jgi:hypothetical protein
MIRSVAHLSKKEPWYVDFPSQEGHLPRQIERSEDLGREDVGERLGHDRAVAGLRVGASAHQNDRFRHRTVLQAVNTAPHVPRQNVPGRVSPSEEGDQEGGKAEESLPVVDRYTARQSPACLHTNAQVVSIPSSCPSPSGEGTRGRRSLLWVAYRPSRRWHLGSGHGRTCRTESLPRRREMLC